MSTYDAIIIGGGQAGMPLSQALAKAGWKTALVERKHLGGTCVNEGCTPTKTMVASARVAYLARRGADYGVMTGNVAVNLERVRERKRTVVNSFRMGQEKRVVETENLTWLEGEARFIATNILEVNCNDGSTHQLTAKHIFINAGARPTIPNIPGLAKVVALDSTSVMELPEVPEHLIVLGGGYIGLEFSQMFRRFGSQVTVIQHGPQLLGREDEDVAKELAAVLTEDGIDVLLNTVPLEVKQHSAGVQLEVKSPEGLKTIIGSHLLLATGRTPNSDRLNLLAVGIEVDKRGFIVVNNKLETNVPGVYALGDIKGGPAFTHISYDDYRIIKTNMLGQGQINTEGRMMPYTVFTDPQLGRIGLSEQEAKAKGLNYQVAKMPMSYVARALELDETRGFMKAVVDADSKQILGFVALSLEGGEIASLVQVAMMGNLPYTALRDGIFPHPGFAESMNNLFNNFKE
jgi:pyruvate/2-oxoglutarate dehydrogenase complex dihydrolipoamide dehydrogenase (E3) component